MDKPIIEQMKENVPTMNDVKDGTVNTFNSIGESIQEAKTGLQNSLNDFSNKSMVDASNEYLQSNSIVAKFVFILLVFIVFMMLLKISMAILGYFLAPKTSPYLIKGVISGNEKVVIYQDPKNTESIPILKSNDRNKGIEFTWSSWIYLNQDQTSLDKYVPIFVKGEAGASDALTASQGLYLSNGPGLYVSNNKDDVKNSKTYNLEIIMDHVDNISVDNTNLEQSRDKIKTDNMPINKWFHLAIRMQNMIMDIYVNGTIVKRHTMDKIPKQNFHNVVAGGGFSGKISNLRYYDYALNVFEINNIVLFGPNLKPSEQSMETASGSYSYLSNLWYHKSYNN
jgi:hypothetical protein